MTAKWHHAATLAGNPNGRTHYDIGDDEGGNIALVYPSEDHDGETLRIARLISASQELLEFAEQIFTGLDTGMLRMVDSIADETLENILGRGRKALAKAKPTHNSPPVLGGEFRRRLR